MLAKRPSRSGAAGHAQKPAGGSPASGAVRIIGGDLRGSKLPVPDHPGLRPTPDRVRQTLFDWLRPGLPGARVLDLFAGTGALAIEALSQGAGSALLVEADRGLAEALRSQLQRLKLAERAELRCASALDVLAQLPQPVDLVLLDPPYALDLWSPCLRLLAARGLLKPGGRIYLEWPEPQGPPDVGAYAWHRQGRAGGVGFGLLRAAS